MAPFVVLAGPRGISCKRLCLSSIAFATCSEMLCRLSKFEYADANCKDSSISNPSRKSFIASKSFASCDVSNFSLDSYTAINLFRKFSPAVSRTTLKNIVRSNSSHSSMTSCALKSFDSPVPLR